MLLGIVILIQMLKQQLIVTIIKARLILLAVVIFVQNA
jgi:hypothetical protein